MKYGILVLLAGFVLDTWGAQGVPGQSWEDPPSQQAEGVFWRYHWYERGLAAGNPAFAGRFRVNAPDSSLDPEFGNRVEARENGMMLIRAEEDLFRIRAAEFYCEAWGGHPGTANKRMTVNGRNTYPLPRVGTEEEHCTYFYPSVRLLITDLVNGFEAIQFAIDRGTASWGHMLVDNAAIRFALSGRHPDLLGMGLASFRAAVNVEALSDSEGFRLTLVSPPDALEKIARVDFEGWYYGYDENGNLKRQDWHGFTRNRLPAAVLGTTDHPPFTMQWDTSMIPAQEGVAIRAEIRFKTDPDLVYLTAAAGGVEIERRGRSRVVLFSPHDLPRPFWSRANQLKSCHLDLNVDPARIENAELHTVAWTGGAGGVTEYFRLNTRHYPVAEGNRHELVYTRLKVDPAILRRGLNRIELLSDTEHHGVEVSYPGPALMVRYREAP